MAKLQSTTHDNKLFCFVREYPKSTQSLNPHFPMNIQGEAPVR